MCDCFEGSITGTTASSENVEVCMCVCVCVCVCVCMCHVCKFFYCLLFNSSNKVKSLYLIVEVYDMRIVV